MSVSAVTKQNKKAVLSQGNHALLQRFVANIHHMRKSSQAPKATLRSSIHTNVKTEFNVKWSFEVIQGHPFWGHWQANERLVYILPITKFYLIRKGSEDIAAESTENHLFRPPTVV